MRVNKLLKSSVARHPQACAEINFAPLLARAIGCFLVGSIVSIASSSSVLAASIVGTIGFNVQGTVNTTSPDLTSAIVFTNVRTNNTATGDWTAFNSGSIPGGLLATASTSVPAFDANGQSFSFSDAGFGSFTGTILSDSHVTLGTKLFSIHARSLQVAGMFTPGATLVASSFTSSVFAEVNLFFMGFDGVGQARSASVTMTTVPEPGTIFGMVAGGFALLGFSRKRLRKARTPSPTT